MAHPFCCCAVFVVFIVCRHHDSKHALLLQEGCTKKTMCACQTPSFACQEGACEAEAGSFLGSPQIPDTVPASLLKILTLFLHRLERCFVHLWCRASPLGRTPGCPTLLLWQQAADFPCTFRDRCCPGPVDMYSLHWLTSLCNANLLDTAMLDKHSWPGSNQTCIPAGFAHWARSKSLGVTKHRHESGQVGNKNSAHVQGDVESPRQRF